MSEYLIATSVLEAIVRGSLDGDDRLRIHASLPLARVKPVDVTCADEECRVSVHLDARMGEDLPRLAASSRRRIADAVTSMTGLRVSTIDVTFSGVFPIGA
jgi:uncharacterized alkaline shock family protein YloU